MIDRSLLMHKSIQNVVIDLLRVFKAAEELPRCRPLCPRGRGPSQKRSFLTSLLDALQHASNTAGTRLILQANYLATAMKLLST
uniref:Uncharacterized protein n=1 Tax=Arthrobacter sp. J3.53 TaxID=347215 RepID=I3W1V3_9MICC|nr:hypothetical protein [Arthrobacter sp. J3.53]